MKNLIKRYKSLKRTNKNSESEEFSKQNEKMQYSATMAD